MAHEHDKEIDSLLRRLAKNEAVAAAIPASGTHIDADEISVYAENALPEKARSRVTAHLADCGRCRTILSNVVSLNAEEKAAEAASPADEAAGIAIDLGIPWYRKLFAVRGLSMAMGAVAVLLAGFLTIVVIRNISGPASEVAERSDYNTAGTNAAQVTNLSASEAAPAENDSGNAIPEPAKQPPGSERAEDRSQRPESPPGLDKNRLKKVEADRRRDADDAQVADKGPVAMATPAATGRTQKNNVALATDIASAPPPAPPPPPVAVAQAESAENRAETERPKVTIAGAEARNQELGSLSAAKSKKDEAATRKVSGKTFVRRNGVWTDYAYKGGEVTKVKKGTDAYRSLDSGLRSIAAQFNSPVIIVWKTKAYRVE